MSFLSSKMTHINEGLCHPDKAREGGDSGQGGQPGFVSVIQERKGTESVCYVLNPKCPWRVTLGLIAPIEGRCSGRAGEPLGGGA